ncbi:MAG: GGDEF domain-containing protein [Rhodospirillales bacterium]
MRYREDFATARRRMNAAVGIMDERRVAPHPENFLVWYDYVSKTNPALCDRLDALLKAGGAIDQPASRSVYEQFYGAGADSDFGDLSTRIETAAAQMMTAIETAGAGAEEYGAALKTFSGGLQGARSGQDFRTLVGDLIASTRAMGERVNHLQSQLNESKGEISQLRDNLAAARTQALTDPLTAIGNRLAFERALAAAAAEAREANEPLSLVMLDLDHFKRINDSYGHPIGDLVLKLVGHTLTKSIKGADTAARYGGEEFAVILPNTARDNAVTVAEQIRLAVANKKIVRKGSGQEIGPVTLSLGVAQYRSHEPLTELVARADAALYTAKQTGRNRVVTELEVVAAA